MPSEIDKGDTETRTSRQIEYLLRRRAAKNSKDIICKKGSETVPRIVKERVFKHYKMRVKQRET